MRKPLIFTAIPALILILANGRPDAIHAREPRDHDQARAAVAAGERPSLSAIVAGIEAQYGGRILEIERENEDGRELYEIELLDDGGRVIELDVDAHTGDVIGSEYD